MQGKKSEELDQQWFDEHLRQPVKQLDQLYDPVTPDLAQFERLVHEHKRAVKKKQWRDLALLWLAGCFIFSSMMWLADRHLVWFVVGQTAVAAGAIITIGMKFGRRLSRSWKG